MKLRTLLAASAVCITHMAAAQTEIVSSNELAEIVENQGDTIIIQTEITKPHNDSDFTWKRDRHGNARVVIIEKDESGKRKETVLYSKRKEPRSIIWGLGIDIGPNSYSSRNVISGSNGGDDFLRVNTSRSTNFTLYPVVGDFRLNKKGQLWLSTGIGFNWGNYRFEDGWSIASVDGVTVPSERYRVDGESIVSVSKLTTCYMTIPLMLKFRIPINGSIRRSFYISAGVIGGIKINSYTKARFSNSRRREREFSGFNLNLLRYDLTLRAGYRNVGFFLNYQMSPMFINERGPKLFPYAAGFNVTL